MLPTAASNDGGWIGALLFQARELLAVYAGKYLVSQSD
jgi:hypothetical protein